MHISGIRPTAAFYERSLLKKKKTENKHKARQEQQTASYKRNVLNGEVANLEVERAVNAMKRDQVIHQYQYFVKEVPTL